MTPDYLIVLAKRAVACKSWRWVPGMATVQRERVVLMDDDGTIRLAAPWGGTSLTAVRSFYDSSGACLPDLTDPATLGCLIALVREAWGARLYLAPTQVDQYTFGWVVCSAGLKVPVNPRCEGATEAEALVAALEGAL